MSEARNAGENRARRRRATCRRNCVLVTLRDPLRRSFPCVTLCGGDGACRGREMEVKLCCRVSLRKLLQRSRALEVRRAGKIALVRVLA